MRYLIVVLLLTASLEAKTRTEYMVFCSDSQIGLEAQVEKALEQGWTLQGGVSVSESRYTSYSHTIETHRNYCQALAKKEVSK